jgi:predicted transcriptional regulator
MTLTVRLDTSLESALDSYCAERGVTKSLVVQESLAAYLLDAASAKARANSAAAGPGKAAAPVSANYKAFAEAGLIGAGELGGVSATNQVVRERAMQIIRRKAP